MWWAGLVQAGMGAIQTLSSLSAMNKLPKSQEFEVTQGLRDVERRYQTVADQGASSAERAAFNQMMARQTNSANRTLRNVGMGGLAGSVSGIYNIDAQNRFAASSEAIRRQGLAGLAGVSSQIQGIKNMNTSAFNTELNMQRQALGNAMQAGTQNMVGGITGSMGAKFAQDQNQAYLDAFGPNNQGVGQNTTQSPYANNPSPLNPNYIGANGQGYQGYPSANMPAYSGTPTTQNPYIPGNSNYMFQAPPSNIPYYQGTTGRSTISGGNWGNNLYGFKPLKF